LLSSNFTTRLRTGLLTSRECIFKIISAGFFPSYKPDEQKLAERVFGRISHYGHKHKAKLGSKNVRHTSFILCIQRVAMKKQLQGHLRPDPRTVSPKRPFLKKSRPVEEEGTIKRLCQPRSLSLSPPSPTH
jgi:hypothetical protein